MRPAAALAIVFGMLAAGCAPPPAPSAKKGPPPVEYLRVATRTVDRVARAVGQVQTAATVTVRPRVGGVLQKALVKDGAAVSAGQLLFELDREPYQVALEQAKALVEKDRAALSAAEAQNRRLEDLARSGTAAQEDLEANRATVSSLRAAIRGGEAAVKAADLRLSYCTIRAPLAGRIGEVLVDEGNLVQADQAQGLAVINQIDPIEASFALPQKLFGDIRAAEAAGPVKVLAYPPGGDPAAPEVGTLAAIDNAADANTGTIRMTARFRNPHGRLWPGLYLEVAVRLGEWRNAVLAPPGAVQAGQRGSFAYVVGADGAIEMRELEIADETEQGVVVAKGLADGDAAVVNGHLRVAPGMKVAARSADPRGTEPRGGEAKALPVGKPAAGKEPAAAGKAPPAKAATRGPANGPA